MLCLSRKPDESIVITVPPSAEPQEVRVTVVEIRGLKARLGVVAKREVTVDREEIHAREAA